MLWQSKLSSAAFSFLMIILNLVKTFSLILFDITLVTVVIKPTLVYVADRKRMCVWSILASLACSLVSITVYHPSLCLTGFRSCCLRHVLQYINWLPFFFLEIETFFQWHWPQTFRSGMLYSLYILYLKGRLNNVVETHFCHICWNNSTSHPDSNQLIERFDSKIEQIRYLWVLQDCNKHDQLI